MRFVIISFLFMGFAFYELSGGADFEPRGRRPAPEAAAESATGALAARSGPAAGAEEAGPRAPDDRGRARAAALVARPALVTAAAPAPDPAPSLAERADISARDDGAPDPAAIAVRPAARPDLAPFHSPFGAGTGGFSNLAPAVGDSITLTTLEQGVGGLRQARPEPAAPDASADTFDRPLALPEPDIREITGTRVNMRDGPGTIYPVVARLNIGQQVEVLSESGTGWLRLRVLQDRRVGWIAASLVSKKTAQKPD